MVATSGTKYYVCNSNTKKNVSITYLKYITTNTWEEDL